MAGWPVIEAGINATLLSEFGERLTYSRADLPGFTGSGLAPFTITGVPNTSGEFATPLSPLYGSVFVRIADIPSGPQKGDDVVIAALTYKVQQIFPNAHGGTAELKLRWTGQ
jgi:hypothetical protein